MRAQIDAQLDHDAQQAQTAQLDAMRARMALGS